MGSVNSAVQLTGSADAIFGWSGSHRQL